VCCFFFSFSFLVFLFPNYLPHKSTSEPGSTNPKILEKFWKYLGGEGVVEDPTPGTQVEPPEQQFLFSVVAGKGFVEMPVVKGRLSSRKLKSSGCYILDSSSHVSLWVGKDSRPNYRLLCWALAQELFKAVERPSWSYIERIVEGTETEVFKLNFKDWITVIKVDHARYLQATEANGMWDLFLQQRFYSSLVC